MIDRVALDKSTRSKDRSTDTKIPSLQEDLKKSLEGAGKFNPGKADNSGPKKKG